CNAEKGEEKPEPLPWVETGRVQRSMVSRASAVGCHPLREVPSLRRRGGPILLRRALSLAAAVRAWALVATAAGARLADHAESVSLLAGAGCGTDRRWGASARSCARHYGATREANPSLALTAVATTARGAN